MKSIITIFLFLSLSLTTADTLSAKITIMPLGDSITLGVGPVVPFAELNGYRRDLRDLLKSSGYDIDFVGSLSNGDPDFTDKEHEGHPGWHDDHIAANVYTFLTNHPAQIVLLHIGTNDISADPNYTNPADVAAILNEIDRWEADTGKTAIVVLAEIINRSGHVCPNPSTTTTFNQNVRQMALNRIADPVHADRIVMVDLECSAGLNYLSDMADTLHPNAPGYAKMATKWFADGLLAILPQADAGVDQTVNEKTLVTLNGSGSNDPDGTVLVYLWSQISPGTIVTLSDPTIKKPTFRAPVVGASGERLTFKLTVTDTDGFKHSDTVFVDVRDVLIPPEADAGADQTVTQGRTVTLDGAGSIDPDDPGGTFSLVKWEQIAGKNHVDLTTPGELMTTFTAPPVDSDGDVLTFKLTVRDTDDLVGEDSVNVTITAASEPVPDSGSGSGGGGGGGGCFIQAVVNQ